MNGKKLRLGLIGKDVSKSTSGQIHTFILRELGIDCEYEKFSVGAEDFDTAMRSLLGDFDAFNVTIPYKRDVLEYLDGVDGDALACGAVNTVINATKTGYSTDGEGFMLMLASWGLAVKGKKTLVLGAGGSGRSVAVALKKAGANVFAYRRNQEELLEFCEQLGVQAATFPNEGGFDILINCTGVGMHDTVGISPLPQSAFSDAETAVDLIYEPKESEFLRLAKAEGLKTLNGAAMLFYQAYYADCLFLNRKADVAEAKKFYDKYVKENTEV